MGRRWRPLCIILPPLWLSGVGALDETPRVVWAGLNGDLEVVERVWFELDERLGDAGFTRESRPFRPHLTIGRFKRPRGARVARRWRVVMFFQMCVSWRPRLRSSRAGCIRRAPGTQLCESKTGEQGGQEARRKLSDLPGHPAGMQKAARASEAQPRNRARGWLRPRPEGRQTNR